MKFKAKQDLNVLCWVLIYVSNYNTDDRIVFFTSSPKTAYLSFSFWIKTLFTVSILALKSENKYNLILTILSSFN